MIKKILLALGVSMMSTLPMTQASPMSMDSEINCFVPMEVKIDVSINDSDKKDNKNNPPPTMRTEGKEDHTNKDKTNPPPKPPEKNGQSIDGSNNPPPPPSDKEAKNKPNFNSNEKHQTKVEGSTKEEIKEKKDKKDKPNVNQKVKEDLESKTTMVNHKDK